MGEEAYKNEPYTDDWLEDPRFANAGKLHDWRNHVGERTQALWATFTTEQKLAIVRDADDLASQEDWN